MNYLAIILIVMVSVFCGNFIYYKTNVCEFIIDRLKINTKIKCALIHFVAFVFGMMVFSNILISYKNIFSDVVLFLAVLITGLSEYIRREIK